MTNTPEDTPTPEDIKHLEAERLAAGLKLHDLTNPADMSTENANFGIRKEEEYEALAGFILKLGFRMTNGHSFAELRALGQARSDISDEFREANNTQVVVTTASGVTTISQADSFDIDQYRVLYILSRGKRIAAFSEWEDVAIREAPEKGQGAFDLAADAS